MSAPSAAMVDRPEQIDGLEFTRLESGGCNVEITGEDKVHYLNDTAAVILLLCDGQRPITEIAKWLQREYDLADPPEEEVSEIVTEFLQAGLVRTSPRSA